MARFAPIELRPLRADLAIAQACLRLARPAAQRPLRVVTWLGAQACLRLARPAAQRPLRVVTWLADEQVLVGIGTVLWTATRFSPSRPLRREADQMLCSLLIAGLMPHMFKYLVRRERPNRALLRRHDTRVARLGNAWDSFPSGHAVHLSAIAASARRLVPWRWRPILTGGLAALAASRVMLLAHYPSDVIAGWGIGALINKAVGAAFGRAERANTQSGARTPPLQPY